MMRKINKTSNAQPRVEKKPTKAYRATQAFFEEKARRRKEQAWLKIPDLEDEYDLKSGVMEYYDRFELREIYLEEFLTLEFYRENIKIDAYSPICPFEEIQSDEYQIWLEQKKRGLGQSGNLESAPIDYSGYTKWRYNPVIFYLVESKVNVDDEESECKKKEIRKPRHRLLLNDDRETLNFLRGRKFAITSPVTYVGRTCSYRNARYLYAIAIDLDEIDAMDLKEALNAMSTGYFPKANIIVNSGHGVHLYFLFKHPIAMYQTRIKALNQLKAGLTRLVWQSSAKGMEAAQIQSVIQGFRLPGTLTKFGRPIRAFYNAKAPLYTPKDLAKFLIPSDRLSDEELALIDEKYIYTGSSVSLQKAKELWPEWYESKVVQKNSVGKKWNMKTRGLYDWWLKRLKEGTEVMVHHRYWCLVALAVFGVKCDVPKEEVLADALALVPSFNEKTETVDNPFTEQDARDAMSAYTHQNINWSVKKVQAYTKIPIERSRRNGRDRAAHLKRARFSRDINCEDAGKTSWREGNGRKPQRELVKEWRSAHPESMNKALCARETGLSRPTVYKWWDM